MVLGLPLHPLLVHFALVLLLAAGTAQVLVVLLPRFRLWLGWGMPVLAVVAAVTARVTQHYGAELERTRNLQSPAVEHHAEWGVRSAWLAIALAVVSILYWLATSPMARARWTSRWPVWLTAMLAVVAVLVSLGALVSVTITGHSGADAVWGR